MSWDLANALMQATVQVEQALPDGRHTIGTGFLINDPTPDGRARTVLVTANHVFNRMPGPRANLGFRVRDADGGWRFEPAPIDIRAGVAELWSHNPNHDVAAIAIKAPPEFARAAIPLAWLADADAFRKSDLGPGDEMMVLGYPQGLSADGAGFPILRSGRVASPVDPPAQSPTFLLDFRVFPGNSGGPVFIADDGRRDAGGGPAQPFVAGMLTQQVELNSERLEIGIVTDAQFIRDTIAQLDSPNTPAPASAVPAQAGMPAASVTPAARPRDHAVVGRAISD